MTALHKLMPQAQSCHPSGWGNWALGFLRSVFRHGGGPETGLPIKPSYSLGFMGWQVELVTQESTRSCHKSDALALAWRGVGGKLIKSLVGGKSPISTRQRRTSLNPTRPSRG